jgi:hypothetical protein
MLHLAFVDHQQLPFESRELGSQRLIFFLEDVTLTILAMMSLFNIEMVMTCTLCVFYKVAMIAAFFIQFLSVFRWSAMVSLFLQ